MSRTSKYFSTATNYRSLPGSTKADYGFDPFIYVGMASVACPKEYQFSNLFNWYQDFVKNNGEEALHQILINRNIRETLPKDLKWIRTILEVYH